MAAERTEHTIFFAASAASKARYLRVIINKPTGIKWPHHVFRVLAALS
jgi:hypothetical protein